MHLNEYLKIRLNVIKRNFYFENFMILKSNEQNIYIRKIKKKKKYIFNKNVVKSVLIGNMNKIL